MIMILESYINDLLYRYDCVVVPGFGAFLTHRISAKINKANGSFYPPQKVLSFNAQLQQNDGLLANYMAETEAISYTAAVENISNQIKAINGILTEGETLTFINIGKLLLNSEGKIVFEPFDQINYLTSAFGLSHFRSATISREVNKGSIAMHEQSSAIALTTQKRNSRYWLKYAAAAIIVLGISGFLGTNYYAKSIDKHNQLAQEEASALLDAKVQQATFVISNPLPAATLMVEKRVGQFHIVGGSFRNEENANKTVTELRAEGFKARCIGKNRHNLFQVVYGSFDTRDDAQQTLFSIRKSHNPEAWLLTKALD